MKEWLLSCSHFAEDWWSAVSGTEECSIDAVISADTGVNTGNSRNSKQLRVSVFP